MISFSIRIIPPGVEVHFERSPVVNGRIAEFVKLGSRAAFSPLTRRKSILKRRTPLTFRRQMLPFLPGAAFSDVEGW